MKTFTCCFAMILLAPVFANGQHVNDIPLDSIEAPYMEMSPRSMMGPKLAIDLDFGQTDRMMGRINTIRHENDEPIFFNSVMHALGFLHDYGYELDHVYVTGEDSSTPHYILKRRRETAMDDN